MEWNKYLENLIKYERCLNGIDIEIDGIKTDIPAIVKSSVYMLEKMIRNQGKFNLFVFPDGDQLPFLFMISKLFYNINIGKIDKEYNPEDFIPGQKLKLKNAIVEFEKIEYDPQIGEKCIYVRNSEYTHVISMEIAPFFQKVDTKRKISSSKVYREALEEVEEELKKHSATIKKIIDLKTYMHDSIYYVAAVSKCKELAKNLKIDGESIYDTVLIGQTNYTGKIEIVKGKDSGTPALVFASQIAYVNEAVRSGAKCQSVIINLIECDINNQLPDLDILKTYDVPIVCITDTVNSFELIELEKRGFNIWRWDADSISRKLYPAGEIVARKRIVACVNEKVFIEAIPSCQIDKAFSNIYKYRKNIEDESQGMNRLFSILFSIAYFSLRNVRKVADAERKKILEEIEVCEEILCKEKVFLDENTYEDFEEAIEYLREVYTSDIEFPKNKKTIDILSNCTGKRVCLICGNNDNPEEIRADLVKVLPENNYDYRLKVCSIRDYLKNRDTNIDIVILSGWFSGASVRRVIYGYDTKEIYILSYSIEKKWETKHSKLWKRSLNNYNNKRIVQNSLTKGMKDKNIEINTEEEIEQSRVQKKSNLDQDDLDYVLQENKYRKYCSHAGKDGEEVVDAKPVSYVGGTFSLFRKGHKVIVCTNIIHQITNKIEEKDVDSLSVGDFLVVRESSKDLVREVADKILEKNNLLGLRNKAEIWKEALRIEYSFSDFEEIVERLREVGCLRSPQTIRNWISNEELIIPQEIEDLKAIAIVTQDSVLNEKLDEIFEAGNTIKRAHIKAGKILSDRLTDSIGNILNEKQIIDPYNIWDPIELVIDGVGPVKILKITDIGQTWILVNYSDTNKVLSEEKGDGIWQE